MQETQQAFDLSVWISRLTTREWILGVVLLLILIGPGILGRSKPTAPVAPPAPEPVQPVKVSSARKSPRRKKTSSKTRPKRRKK